MGKSAASVKGARHEALYAALVADIHAGRHAVGSALPTEAELQSRFGASRYAVREALRQLKEAGLVTSHAGIGTIVRARRAAPRGVQMQGSLDDILQLVRDTRFAMVAERDLRIDAASAARLSVAEGETWRVFELLRYQDARKDPLARLNVHVRPEFAVVGADIGKSGQPVFRLIEERFGERVTEVQQQVTAARLGAAHARLLRAKAGTPALLVIRRFVNDAGRAILVSEGLYPEGRFSLANRLTLGPAARS